MYYRLNTYHKLVLPFIFSLFLILLVFQTTSSANEYFFNSMMTLRIKQVPDSSFDKKKLQVTDGWFSEDKGRHLVGSLIGTVFITNINRHAFGLNDPESKFSAAGFVISLGFAKEFLDNSKKGNFFSWKDIFADLTGILIGIIILGVK